MKIAISIIIILCVISAIIYCFRNIISYSLSRISIYFSKEKQELYTIFNHLLDNPNYLLIFTNKFYYFLVNKSNFIQELKNHPESKYYQKFIDNINTDYKILKYIYTDNKIIGHHVVYKTLDLYGNETEYSIAKGEEKILTESLYKKMQNCSVLSDFQHPMYYDVFNVLEIQKTKKLNKLKKELIIKNALNDAQKELMQADPAQSILNKINEKE